jgi:hypothetical protein
MSDRLDFETRLEDRLLARAAVASRPFDAAEIARRVVAANGRRRSIGWLAWPSTRPALGWLVVALLLTLALLGAIAGIGALPRNEPVRTSYEAVFLRLEVVGGSPEVLVVSFNAEGREREIARLPGAWVAYDIQASATERGFLAPMGAVSPTGLLAIPSDRGDANLQMRWEIFDLHRPEAEPIVIAGIQQFVESLRETPYFEVDPRGGAFWGPGERLAILWYPDAGGAVNLQLTYVEGRTGAATPVGLTGTVLPQWASDGSGVFVGAGRILRLDGSETDATGMAAEPSCRTRYQSGAEITVSGGGIGRRNADGGREGLLSRTGIGYACLAPDDSTIVHNIEIGEGRGPATAARPIAGLLVAGSGDWLEIQGNFAGWLEVAR